MEASFGTVKDFFETPLLKLQKKNLSEIINKIKHLMRGRSVLLIDLGNVHSASGGASLLMTKEETILQNCAYTQGGEQSPLRLRGLILLTTELLKLSSKCSILISDPSKKYINLIHCILPSFLTLEGNSSMEKILCPKRISQEVFRKTFRSIEGISLVDTDPFTPTLQKLQERAFKKLFHSLDPYFPSVLRVLIIHYFFPAGDTFFTHCLKKEAVQTKLAKNLLQLGI